MLLIYRCFYALYRCFFLLNTALYCKVVFDFLYLSNKNTWY